VAVAQNTRVPTLPLLENRTPTDADGPRLIVAPGGYQWWYFEANDPVADVRVTAILFDGNPFHPKYLRRYAWYRRMPTRFAPPVPSEFPGVVVRVYEKGEAVGDAAWHHGPGACRATSDGVTIGADGFTRNADGAMRLTIRGSLDLTFTPKSLTPRKLHEVARGASVAEPHGWVVSNPHCDVTGEVTVNGRPVRFDGLGYQDHNYGAEPIHLAARRWFWSVAWLDDQALVAAELVPTRGQSWGVQLMNTTTLGSATWDARTRLRIPYPTMVDFGDALCLDEPRVIESTPILVQLRYRARIGEVTTTALAHVVEPGRAGWPVVGRLLERLIQVAPRS
jgi:hypothetical protein